MLLPVRQLVAGDAFLLPLVVQAVVTAVDGQSTRLPTVTRDVVDEEPGALEERQHPLGDEVRATLAGVLVVLGVGGCGGKGDGAGPSPDKVASVTVEGAPVPLGSTVEHHLLRIAQEAIANAVKHSGANHVDVQLKFSDETLELAIQDDGCGFDPKTVMAIPGHHFGLRSFRGRAGKIGGAVEVVSQPGQGTRVTVYVPVEVTAVV